MNQAVWHGRVQEFPKTKNAIRTVALSLELAAMLWEQAERQKAKGHNLVFSTSTGKPVDAGLHPFLESLEIPQFGFHAFRHFNASLLGSLRVPLKVIQERLGHAAAGSLTLDVYTHAEWEQNVEAAQQAGEALEKEVDSVRLTAHQQKGPADENRQVLEAA